MSEAARGRATYADLAAVSDDKVAEILCGDLPRPGGPHTIAASALMAEVGGPFGFGRGGPGGWWIVVEPELHLGDDVLVPDLAGWKRDRLPVYPDGPFVDLAPDWVCEVVSSGTQRHDRVLKLPIFAREKVAHCWLVDPVAQTLEVFRLERGRWLLVSVFSGNDPVGAEPFEAQPIRLGLLWHRGP